MILPPRPIVEPEIGDLSALNSTTCDLIEVLRTCGRARRNYTAETGLRG
jgi:hypothetical protein